MKIIIFIINKIRMLFMYIGLILSFIFLGLGTILMDILLTTIGVEKAYLLSTDLLNWSDVVNAYINTMKNNKGEK